MNGPIVYSYKPIPGAENMIYNRISDITISMKAVDYLKMPELVSSRYEVQMDDKEKQKYEELKKDLVLEIENGEITAANAASLSGKLSQMANGAVYSDDLSVVEIHDKKLDVRRHIVGGANRTLISALLSPRLRSCVGDRRLWTGQPHAVVALFERQASCF